MEQNWICAVFVFCAIGNVCSVDKTTQQSMTVQQFSSNKDTVFGPLVKLATKSVTTQRLESTLLTDPTSSEVTFAETTVKVTLPVLTTEATAGRKVTKPESATTAVDLQLGIQTTADVLTAAPSETQTEVAATTAEEKPDTTTSSPTERETAALRTTTAPVMATEERQPTVSGKKTTVKVSETTEVVTEGLTTAEAVATESQDSPATTAYGWTGEDPCDPSVPINMTGDQRHFTQVGASKHCDSAVENGYYRFLHQGKPAVIPTECIRGGYCSTDHPIRIDLEGNTMPTVVGQSVKVHSCLYTIVAGKPDCCSVRNKAVITKCDNYYVYYLQKVDRCNVGFCIKLPHETISEQFIGSRIIGPLVVTTSETTQEVTTTPGNGKKIHVQVKNTKKPLPSKPHRVAATTQQVTTTTEPLTTTQRTTVGAADTTGSRQTTAKQSTQPLYPMNKLSPNQRSNIVTFVFSFNNAKALERFDDGLRRALIDILLGRIRRRTRRGTGGATFTQDGATFTHDGIKFVYKSVGNGTVELSLFVQNGTNSDDVVPVDRLLNFLNDTNIVDYLETQLNMTLVSVKAGLPASGKSPLGTEEKRKSIFEAHLGLWIVILVLACICIVCILITVIVLKCCQHRWNKKPNLADKEQMPLEEGPQGVTESPLSDEEIMKDETAPQLEATPNGNGVPAKHVEEENGWVVPMEELDPPDVEDTKL